MDRETVVKTLLRELEALPRSVAVEVAYLVVEWLGHGWTKIAFRARVGAERNLPYQQTAADLAFKAISTIERSEGVDVSELAASVRRQYQDPLLQVVMGNWEANKVDRRKVNAALRELRKVA